MQRPVLITFRGMEPSEAVEAKIRQKAAWLEKYYDRLIGCEVVVEAPPQHSRKGAPFMVTVELRVPGGPPIVATHSHHEDPAHEDVYVAIRDTFNAARRRLLEFADR
jgi:ribosome-associated translation inhibitor RaiA